VKLVKDEMRVFVLFSDAAAAKSNPIVYTLAFLGKRNKLRLISFKSRHSTLSSHHIFHHTGKKKSYINEM
jgi:hypothetical protein